MSTKTAMEIHLSRFPETSSKELAQRFGVSLGHARRTKGRHAKLAAINDDLGRLSFKGGGKRSRLEDAARATEDGT